jgi:hypothetical protein
LLAALILVAAVANLNLAVSDVAVPDIGRPTMSDVAVPEIGRPTTFPTEQAAITCIQLVTRSLNPADGAGHARSPDPNPP